MRLLRYEIHTPTVRTSAPFMHTLLYLCQTNVKIYYLMRNVFENDDFETLNASLLSNQSKKENN